MGHPQLMQHRKGTFLFVFLWFKTDVALKFPLNIAHLLQPLQTVLGILKMEGVSWQ